MLEEVIVLEIELLLLYLNQMISPFSHLLITKMSLQLVLVETCAAPLLPNLDRDNCFFPSCDGEQLVLLISNEFVTNQSNEKR